MISNLLSYFFAKAPGAPSIKVYSVILIIQALLVIGGLILGKVYNNKKKSDIAYKKLFKKFHKRLITLGIILIFLTLVRFENIPYFAMRIWTYLTLALAAAVIIFYGKQYLKEYQKMKENIKSNKKTKTKKSKKYTTSKK